MKKYLSILLFVCMALLSPGCEKSGPGGGGGSSGSGEELPEYPEGTLLAVELEPAEDVFDYYLTDGETDICIMNSDETSKPLFAIVQDRVSKESFGIFFSEDGHPMMYEHKGTYILLDNFSGTRADVAVINEEGEIKVYREAETGVDWDNGFYEYWNAPSTRAIDWKRLGGLYLDELRLIGVGVGYGIKAIPSIIGMRYGDPLAYVGFASNFVDMLDEAIPDNKYIKATKLTLDAAATGTLAGKVLNCRRDVSSCLEVALTGLYEHTGKYLSDISRPEKEEQFKLAEYVLAGGYGTIQVTLRWNNVNDIDLHVRDPNGESIYWNHKNSASGGYLDFDNTESHGPENIFWHEARLTGDYYVYVDHYAGNTSAQYTVYIDAFGHSKTLSGVINRFDTKLVAVFDEQGINTNVTLLPPMLSRPAAERKPLETAPRGEAKTGFPDLQKIKDRIGRTGKDIE